MKNIAIMLLVIFGLPVGLSNGQEKRDAAALEFVKYTDLSGAIAKSKGKVVIVDFWQSTCRPCIAALPKIVAFQHEHASEGLVLMTVALDASDNAAARGALTKTLQNKGVAGPNYWLNEPPEIWQTKLRFSAVPATYVFDRNGKWTKFVPADDNTPLDYDAVDRLALELLGEK